MRVARVFARLLGLVAGYDVFRGQVITIESSPSGTRLVFVERPHMDVGELVLPDGRIERVERHLAGPSVHRETLLATGRHMSRGLLLHSPPGTGKTHTVRYLTGRLRDATVTIPGRRRPGGDRRVRDRRPPPRAERGGAGGRRPRRRGPRRVAAATSCWS